MDTSATHHTVFEHQDLDLSLGQIRVLEVLPDNSGTGLMSCHPTQQSLSEGSYTALSYTWEASDKLIPIEVDGQEFLVLQNLFDFLKHAKTPGLRLWIDAVCIDQSNISERNHQVRLMSKIYSKAAEVLIWLGRGDPVLEIMFVYAAQNLGPTPHPSYQY